MIENENKQKEESSQACKERVIKLIYSTYTQLHNQNNVNIPTTCILIALSFLNLFSYILNSEIGVFRREGSKQYSETIMELFSVFYFAHGESNLENLRITTAIISVFLIVSLFSLAWLMCTYSSKDKFTKSMISPLFYYTSLLIFWFLLMPIIEISLHLFTYRDATRESYFGNNGLFVLLAILNILIVMTITLLHCFMGHKSLFSNIYIDGFSRADCNFELLYTVLRMITVLLHFVTVSFLKVEDSTDSLRLLSNETNPTSTGNQTVEEEHDEGLSHNIWLIFSFYIISALALFRFNYSKLLFYHSLVCHVFQYFLFYYFWVIIVTMILTLSDYHESSWMLGFGFIFVLPISSGYIRFRLNRIIKNIEFTKLIAEPYLVDKYLKELSHMITNSSPDSENKVIIYGLTYIHHKECSNERCLLHTKELFYIPSKLEFMRKEDYERKTKNYNLVFLLTMYTFYLKQIKHQVILTSYLNFQIEDMGNIIEILLRLYSAETKSNTVQQNFSLFRLTMLAYYKVEDEFKYTMEESENKNYSIDIGNVVEYYSLVSRLKTMMVSTASANYSFWNSFNSENNSSVYDNGLDIFSKNQQLDFLFNKIRSIYAGDIDINRKFSDYVKEIKGDEVLGMKIAQSFEKGEKLDELRSLEKFASMKELFFSPNSVMIIASFANERSCIEKVTESINNVFGYTPQQLLGKDVDTLMPPFFRQRHANYVNFHFETGIKRIINNERELFGLHKSHFMFPIKLLLAIMPNLEDKLVYMAVIQKLSQDNGLMLVHPNGKIDCFNEKLSKKINLQPENLADNELFIYHIVSNYLVEDIKNDRMIDLRSFALLPCEVRRMKFYTDQKIVEEIKKITKTFENRAKYNNPNIRKHSNLHEKNYLRGINDILNSQDTVQSKEIEIDAEIEEAVFNNGQNPKENSLLVLKVYIDDLDENSPSVDSLRNPNGNIFIDSEEKHNEDNVIKDFKELKKESKLEWLLQEKIPLRSSNPLDLAYDEHETSSYNPSTMGSSFYANYSNFRKKLQRCLNEEQKPRMVNYIGRGLLLLLVASTVLIFFFEFNQSKDILEVYSDITSVYSNFLELGCIEQNLNVMLLREVEPRGVDYGPVLSKMKRCQDRLVVNINNITHISRSKINTRIKLQLEGISQEIRGFAGDPTRPESSVWPIFRFIEVEIDYVNNIRSRNFTLVEDYRNVTRVDRDLLYLKNNFRQVSLKLYEAAANITTQQLAESIASFRVNNYVFLIMRLAVVFICFIVILPILIVNKKEQLRVLETFFQIKSDDAELQKEICRKYIASTSNCKIEENFNDEKEGGSKDKEKENKEESAEFIDGDRKIRKLKPKEKRKKDKKGKQSAKKPQTFSSQMYVINILSVILLVIVVISIVPLLNYQYESRTFESTLLFLANKRQVDNHSFYLHRLFLDTQHRFIHELLSAKEVQQRDFIFDISLEEYAGSFGKLSVTEQDFTAFGLHSYYLEYNDDLQEFLKEDMCAVFDRYNVSIPNCTQHQEQFSERGLRAVVSSSGAYLTTISQEIIRQGSLTLNYIRQVNENPDYRKTDLVHDRYLYYGTHLMIEILRNSFESLIEENLKDLIVLFIIFIVIIIVNQLLVWNTIEKRIHTMETDTYKLFSILPLRFILDYSSLLNFLRKVSQDDI